MPVVLFALGALHGAPIIAALAALAALAGVGGLSCGAGRRLRASQRSYPAPDRGPRRRRVR